MKAKRFLVFEFETYYPGGGFSDLVDSFDAESDAIACAHTSKCAHVEVVDLEDLKRDFEVNR